MECCGNRYRRPRCGKVDPSSIVSSLKKEKHRVEKGTNQLMFEETCAFLSPFTEAA